MELNFEHASLQEIINYAPDLRREAYVDATLRMQADDNIVGVFGSAYAEARSPVIDEALIYGCGLVPVPIVGVDAFIFKYGDYPACDAIKSTMVYLTTQKCPLLYSSKMYVLDGCCSAVETAFRQCTQKPVHVYNDAETLKIMLQQVYGCEYSAFRYQEAKAAFATLNRLLQRLEHSALSGNDFGMLAFYSRFIFALAERLAFLTRVYELLSAEPHCKPCSGSTHSACSPEKRVPVSMHCPDGIIQKITPTAGNYFKPVRVQPGNSADIACAGCIYSAAQYVGY